MSKESLQAAIDGVDQAAFAAAALGPKPISDLPGAGMGSYAEDDPVQHAAMANAPLEPPEPA